MAAASIEVPPRSPYVGVVRLATAALARAAGFDEDVVDNIKIAVSEACTTAVLSHEQAGTDDPVTVTWEQVDDAVTIEIADRGISYDPDDLEGDDTVTLRQALSVALLRSLVDRCDITGREGGGMTTRLQLNVPS